MYIYMAIYQCVLHAWVAMLPTCGPMCWTYACVGHMPVLDTYACVGHSTDAKPTVAGARAFQS